MRGDMTGKTFLAYALMGSGGGIVAHGIKDTQVAVATLREASERYSLYCDNPSAPDSRCTPENRDKLLRTGQVAILRHDFGRAQMHIGAALVLSGSLSGAVLAAAALRRRKKNPKTP